MCRIVGCENSIGILTKLQTSLPKEESWVDGTTEKLTALPTATSALELDVSVMFLFIKKIHFIIILSILYCHRLLVTTTTKIHKNSKKLWNIVFYCCMFLCQNSSDLKPKLVFNCLVEQKTKNHLIVNYSSVSRLLFPF